MISSDESSYTYEYKNYYKILPLLIIGIMINKELKTGKVSPNFEYNSDKNKQQMSIMELQNWIKINY